MPDPGFVWRSHAAVARSKDWQAGCPGAFRVEEDEPPAPMIVRCDGCGRTIGVPRLGTPTGKDTPAKDRHDGRREEWAF